MDFDLSEEQQLLKDSIDRLMEKLRGAGQFQASNATTTTDAQPDIPSSANDGFWIDAYAVTNADFARFVRLMIAFRRTHHGLRRRSFFTGERGGLPHDELGIWSPVPGQGVAWFFDPDGNRLSLNGEV